jgi:hypothetical protein
MPTPRRRTVLFVVAGVALALATWRVARWLLPTEADRLAEQVAALGQRVLAGDLEAVLDHVDLERFGLRATALGEGRTFGPDDAERLLAQGRDALDWFPLERASIEILGSEVTDSEVSDERPDEARVAIRFAFMDDDQRYADDFDLELRKVGDRWYLVAVHLRTPRDPSRLGGALRR